jgi:hypothetical protein
MGGALRLALASVCYLGCIVSLISPVKNGLAGPAASTYGAIS